MMIARHKNESVELNVTAMLDMAFQLLAFFVLTFRPGPGELAVQMHMPSARPAIVEHPDEELPGEVATLAVPKALKSVEVNLFSQSGGLDRITINGVPVDSLDDLREKLTKLIHAPGSPVEQVVVQAANCLHYATLMDVVDICARQEPSDARQLVKLRLVAMEDSPGT
jgi:biopolymer transport protein ExbD